MIKMIEDDLPTLSVGGYLADLPRSRAPRVSRIYTSIPSDDS